MQDKKMIEITYVTDCETGMYKIGEIDFNILQEANDYLEHYKKTGYLEICGALDFLKGRLLDILIDIEDKDKNK